MLFRGAVVAVLSIPDGTLNRAFGANRAIPKRSVVRTADTFLRNKIVEAFWRAALTLEGSEIPIGGHIALLAIFSIIVRVFWRALADFINIVNIGMDKFVLLLF
jgi:hypothetical protein